MLFKELAVMMRSMRVLVTACLGLVALAVCSCGNQPKVPSSIRGALGEHKLIAYEQGISDGGQRSLSLSYSTAADLVKDWPAVTSEVERIWPALRTEADKIGAADALIAPHSPTDYASFGFHRRETGEWVGEKRELEPRTLADGTTLLLRHIDRENAGDPPILHVDYMTRVGYKNRPALRAELDAVAAAFGEEAQRAGVEELMLIPRQGIHYGGSGAFVYRRSPKDGKWYEENELRQLKERQARPSPSPR